jgi:hypothetical protein
MKKILLVLVAVVFSFSVYAQKAEEIKVSELPKKITSWVSQTFKKDAVERAAKVMDNKILLGYCAAVTTEGRKTIFVFDKNGNFLEKIGRMKELQRVFKPAQPSNQPVKK